MRTSIRLDEELTNFDYARTPIKSSARVSGDTPYLGASGEVDRVEGYTHDGDFLCISEDGENLRSRNTPIAWVQRGQFWANNHVHVLGGISLPRLRFYEATLAVAPISNYLTGSAQPKLSQAALHSIKIPKFSAAEQQAIGEVLGALDDKIAANRQVARSGLALIDEAFTWRTQHSPRVRIQEIANFYLGGTPARNNPDFWGGSIPWLNSGACNSRLIISPSEFITKMGLEKSAAKMLPGGSTCIAITGATLGQMGWLASPMAANQSVVGVAAREQESLWVHAALRSEVDQLLGWSTGGAQQHVNKNAVASLEIPYSRDEALEFGAKYGALMNRAVAAEQESTKLAATRDELLPLLISGRITVKDAEKTVEDVI